MTLAEELLALIVALTGVPAPEVSCLAANIYHESRGESFYGQWLVGSTTVNRERKSNFPSTLCSVVKEWRRKGLYGCQYSWYCDGKSDRTTDTTALTWAIGVSFLAIVLPIDEVVYYHESSIKPAWDWDKLTALGRIGNHEFYKEKI